jgi:hypothetical protein
VIGLELIGVREFSIEWLRRVALKIPLDMSKVDFDRAKFVKAEPRVYAEV